jgi:hypothetical protein
MPAGHFRVSKRPLPFFDEAPGGFAGAALFAPAAARGRSSGRGGDAADALGVDATGGSGAAEGADPTPSSRSDPVLDPCAIPIWATPRSDATLTSA